MDEVSPAVVRKHVERITTSAGFSNAQRLSRFLRFAVDAKLRGEEGRLKELLIGREVFDRGEAFDARLDPIVRVEARRLRDAPAVPGRPRRRVFVAAASAACVTGVAGFALFSGRFHGSRQPMLAVVPARWVW
jgi:hypothetical protein